MGVGDWEDCEGSGRTQGSVARELDLYLGSTYVNVRQSLSQLQLTQLQDKVISVTPTDMDMRNTEMRRADVTEGQSYPLPTLSTEGTAWDMFRSFSLCPLLTRHTKQTALPTQVRAATI